MPCPHPITAHKGNQSSSLGATAFLTEQSKNIHIDINMLERRNIWKGHPLECKQQLSHCGNAVLVSSFCFSGFSSNEFISFMQ